MRRTKAEIMQGVGHVAGSSRIVGNNTVNYKREDGSDVIRLHRTDIIVTNPDGSVTLNSGGYRTVTTKARINEYIHHRVYQDAGVWYIGDEVPFFDGITIDASGELPDVSMDEPNRVRELTDRINAYVRLIKEVDTLPKPNGGDCWICLMFDKPEPGDANAAGSGDTMHLAEHMREGYVHGSLLVNAMRFAGYRDQQVALHYHMNMRDSFVRATRSYLKARFRIGR